MNKFGRADNRIPKTIQSRCKKPKDELVFEIVLPSNRQRFHISELTQHLLNSLGEPRWFFQESVKSQRAFFKRKIRSENLVPSQFLFEFSLFQVKLDLIVFASPKTTFENKSALISLRSKQKYSLKTSFVHKIE